MEFSCGVIYAGGEDEEANVEDYNSSDTDSDAGCIPECSVYREGKNKNRLLTTDRICRFSNYA